MLLIALGKIRLGTIHKHIKALATLKNFAIQQLGARLNGHRRRALPVAIDALVDHHSRVSSELRLDRPAFPPNR